MKNLSTDRQRKNFRFVFKLGLMIKLKVLDDGIGDVYYVSAVV